MVQIYAEGTDTYDIDELWNQFWEACDELGVDDVYLYDTDESRSGLIIYDFPYSRDVADDIVDYLQEEYPEAYWYAAG